jgi:hypothetical protein
LLVQYIRLWGPSISSSNSPKPSIFFSVTTFLNLHRHHHHLHQTAQNILSLTRNATRAYLNVNSGNSDNFDQDSVHKLYVAMPSPCLPAVFNFLFSRAAGWCVGRSPPHSLSSTVRPLCSTSQFCQNVCPTLHRSRQRHSLVQSEMIPYPICNLSCKHLTSTSDSFARKS